MAAGRRTGVACPCAALLRRSVHGSVPPAAPGMHRYSSTLLLHFITGNLRDLLSVLEYQTTLHVTMAYETAGSVDGCSSIP